jgi:hypothetical protein
MTSCFHLFYQWTGECSIPGLNFNQCVLENGQWSGWDISGHVFLLLLSSLEFWEELKHSSHAIDVIICAFLALWGMMYVITCCYYHHTLEKLMGWVFAMGYWYLTRSKLLT